MAATTEALLPSKSVQDIILARLKTGSLVRASGRTWIHAAAGNHSCAACGRMIRAGVPECEVADRVELHAHVSCFKVWVKASREAEAGWRPMMDPPARAVPAALRRAGESIATWSRALGLALVFGGALLLAHAGHAAATPILPTQILPNLGGEPSLEGDGGVLDLLYGLGNLLRMDDGVDEMWGNTRVASVRVVAKHSGYRETLGYLPGEHGDAFVPLVSAPDNGLMSAEFTFSAADSGPDFRWGLDPNGAGVAPGIWSSSAGDNADGRDHMVTWRVTGVVNHPDNPIGAFVIGFEDLVDLGDGDYNDLVAEVRGVTDGPLPGEAVASAVVLPAPATLIVIAAGSTVFAGRRRLSRRQ